MSRVRGVCDDVTCSFLHSGVVQVLKAGQVDTMIISAALTVHCSLLTSDSLADPNQRSKAVTFSVDERSTISAEPCFQKRFFTVMP